MNGVTFDFSGSNVLVTGGTSGIGHAVASAFEQAGANVTITGTKASAGDYDTDLSRMDYLQCQMLDPASIDDAVGSLADLDILINNAGGTHPTGQDEWDPEGFTSSLTANLIGPMRLTMGCHRLLKKSAMPGGASVVSIVSMSSFRSAPFVPGYGSAKAGWVALTMNLARNWVGDGIRVNAVAPGIIHTPMIAPGVDLPVIKDVEVGFHTPMGRLGTAEDVAGAVLFLGTAAASFITGTTLAVDGGYLTV